MVPRKLVDALRKKENKVFLVTAHVNLEGDALGSELALASLVRRLGKRAVVVNDGAAPAEYAFLPGVRSIRTTLKKFPYDAAILVDCSDPGRIGRVRSLLRDDRPVLNIDHHVSNTRFGDVNWVVPGASSACEMVEEIFRVLRIKPTRAEALLLYTGLVTDTGSFRYASTSQHTHAVAARLLSSGIAPYDVHRRVFENHEYATVQAIAHVLGTLRRDPTGRVAWVEVGPELRARVPSLAERTDELIHLARSIRGVEVAVLFKSVAPNEVRVNFRSRGRVDVNRIAAVFGGGGHAMASGATVKGEFPRVVQRVVREVQRSCR